MSLGSAQRLLFEPILAQLSCCCMLALEKGINKPGESVPARCRVQAAPLQSETSPQRADSRKAPRLHYSALPSDSGLVAGHGGSMVISPEALDPWEQGVQATIVIVSAVPEGISSTSEPLGRASRTPTLWAMEE